MTILFALILLGLATWRLSSMLVFEDGPANILAKLRFIIGVRYNELAEPVGTNTIADVFTCIWCSSVWIGIFFTILWIVHDGVALIISMPLAISTVAIIVEQIAGERK